MRRFTTTGSCVATKHYMVDTSGKLDKIKALVDDELYFTITRARQYGKTTTLALLSKELRKEYICISMSFENAGQIMFESVEGFCQTFLWHAEKSLRRFYPEESKIWQDESVVDFNLLGEHLTRLCKCKKVVLIIDEIDRASNYRVFVMFLSMLRDKYLDRNLGEGATFHSVILSGVMDVKNLKTKMIVEGTYKIANGEGPGTSPWNIAADFDVDMSFHPSEIATMLKQYEEDHKTGMDVIAISEEIYKYTSGYPFMVSRICQHIDNKCNKDWTMGGIQAAVKIILEEKNTLFSDMSKNLENHADLRELVRKVLIDGVAAKFTTDDVCVDFGVMFGYFKNVGGQVAISNRIFELRMSNYFILRDVRTTKQITGVLKEDVVSMGKFDMALCLEKFATHYHRLFSHKDVAFLEQHGRLLFLSYLQPLINGTGFYHIESETRNTRRMDVVVDYGNDQFIIELKRWYGESAHNKAYEQLLGYMDAKNVSEGYLLTFDFSKKPKPHKPGWVEFGSKRIYDVIVR